MRGQAAIGAVLTQGGVTTAGKLHVIAYLFESSGVETQFTNGLDPQPRSRKVFAFFRPEMLQQWLRSNRCSHLMQIAGFAVK